MEPFFLLVAYCVLLAAASMLGGWLPRWVAMTHLRTQLIISFVAGLMLAIATYQLLPHAFELLGSASLTGGAVLGGILAMFLMIRIFHGHSHAGSPLRVDADDPKPTLPLLSGHPHHHRPGEHCGSCHPQAGPRSRWMGMMIGLGLHGLLDGVALAASVAADAPYGAWAGLLGFGTLIAVTLHKPLDAFAVTSTIRGSGGTDQECFLVNLLFSLISPLGVFLFWVGATQAGMPTWIIGLGLAVSAGVFICIALSDLLPEVHFHSHDRIALTTTLLLGITVAVIIESLPGHRHHHLFPKTAVVPPEQSQAAP